MKLNKFLTVGLAAFALAGLASCDSSLDPDYAPGESPAGHRFFFSSASQSMIVDPESNEFDVYMYRPSDEVRNAVNVPMTITCTEENVLGSIVNIQTTANFAADSEIAMIAVNYDAAQLVGNKNYKFTLAIDPEYASEFGISTMTLTVVREDYTDWAPFGYDEELGRTGDGTMTLKVLFNNPISFDVVVWERHVPSDPDVMQYEIRELVDVDDPSLGYETIYYFYTQDGGKTITVPIQVFMNHPVYGDIYVADTYTFTGGHPDYAGKSFFDPEAGLFTLNLHYWDAEGGWDDGTQLEYCQLVGYADMNDYTFSITDHGQISVGGVDYSILNFTLPAEASYIDYTFCKGILDEDQIAEVVNVIEDPNQTQYLVETVKKAGNVIVTPMESGDYTAVGVCYKEYPDGSAEAKSAASCTFHFDAFDPYAGWKEWVNDALFTDYIFPYASGNQLQPMDLTVSVWQSEEEQGLYRIDNPFIDSPYPPMFDATVEDFGCLEFMALEPGAVFPLSDLGITDEDGKWEIMSSAYYLLINGVSMSEVPADLYASIDQVTGVISMTAPEMPDQNDPAFQTFFPSFLFYFGGDGPFICNTDFYLSLDGQPKETPAERSAFAKTAKKANALNSLNKGAKKAGFGIDLRHAKKSDFVKATNLRFNGKRLHNVAVPARFKAAPASSTMKTSRKALGSKRGSLRVIEPRNAR